MVTARKTAAPVKKAVAKKPVVRKPAVTAMDYGYVGSFLTAHPDVAAKVKLAVAQGWTPARLQAEMKTTSWWTTRTEAQRQADVLAKDNPQEYARQIALKKADISAQAASMGLNLSDADLSSMATTFFTNGASNGEMQSALAMKFQMPADASTPITGDAGTTVDALQSLATAYGVPLDATTAQKYTQQVLAGQSTVQGLTDLFREHAKILYPPVASFLDKNPQMTVQDYATPYLQIAAKELGVPTDQMDLTDSKWSKVLTSGANGPMTADEWTKTIRNDPQYQWGKTVAAKDQAAQMATDLQRTFGAIG